MSLREKAAATAVFGYLKFAVAIVSGLILVPLTLHRIGARTWGVWLVSGELLAYAGMADLGMLGVVQWLIAEAEGRGDRDEMAQLVGHAVWLGTFVAGVYVLVALVLWRLLPSVLFLTAADRQIIQGPLSLTVALTAVSYPLTAYRALLVGTQDVGFFGVLSIASAIVSAVLTAVLLFAGYGLYALVWSAGAPAILTAILVTWRAARIAPDLVFRSCRPQIPRLRYLFTHGISSWMGDMGWQVLAASNAIVITYLGHPEWVPVYACTGKVAAMCLPLAWVLPDSGHVGLAQLYGQGSAEDRVRGTVLMMQRVHLLIAGVAACGLLVFNPAFVTRWVGPSMFDGLPLNTVLAIGVVVHSFTHGLITSASIAGNRPRIGVIVVANALIHLALSVYLGHRFGLVGVATAGVLAVVLTQLPGSAVLLKRTTGLRPASMFESLVLPWLGRAVPVLVVAALVGAFYQTLGLWGSAAAAASLCALYVWQVRPLYARGLPIHPRWSAWMRYFHLLPAQ
jgi:O-antigen/teichoic acid export membrane protein